ncbi:MAG: hypothetical protein QOC85_3612 [Streptomyces sp.]|nr:hypothetical protein [Streptomyces sp.]
MTQPPWSHSQPRAGPPPPHFVPGYPQPPATDRSSRKWTVLEKCLGVFSALLAVVSAVLGVQAASINSEKVQAESSNQDKSQVIQGLEDRVNQLGAENQRLQAENSSLRGRQTATPGGPTETPPAATAATTRHSGKITLARNGNKIDLDSPQSDPQWSSGNNDLEYGGLYGDGGASTLTISSGAAIYLNQRQANYDVCLNSTGYKAPSSYEITDMAVGDQVCVTTNEKRYSALKILELTEQRIVLDVVTYDA